MGSKKILLVTGRQASSTVQKISRKSVIPVKVHVCNVDVASLLSPELVLEELEGKNLDDVSLILLPGSIRGDLSVIQEKLGVSCARGSRNVGDLLFVLEKIYSGASLSMDTPADELFEQELRKRVVEEVEKVKKSKENYTLKVGGVYLGTGLIKIIAEIPDAPLLPVERLKEFARYYVQSGADVIDLGMVSGKNYSARVGDMVETVRSVVDAPIAIDSLAVEELKAGIDAGVDLILSIDESNFKVLDGVDIPAVVIPRDRECIPPKAGDRLRMLESLIGKLQDRGFDKIIADPVLSPPVLGLVESLTAYKMFREKHPDIPLMYGAGNVSELLDADSIGVNALLASIASELKVDLLFTTEASSKTKGAVRELSKAVEMMYLSQKHEMPPKDLGIDLLYLKDKRQTEPIIDALTESLETVEVREHVEGELEDSEFRIYLSDAIEAVYYSKGKPRLKFRGVRAEDLYSAIFSRNLVKEMHHAAYLGRELVKAEIALKLGKNYVQDEDLF